MVKKLLIKLRLNLLFISINSTCTSQPGGFPYQLKPFIAYTLSDMKQKPTTFVQLDASSKRYRWLIKVLKVKKTIDVYLLFEILLLCKFKFSFILRLQLFFFNDQMQAFTESCQCGVVLRPLITTIHYFNSSIDWKKNHFRQLVASWFFVIKGHYFLFL